MINTVDTTILCTPPPNTWSEMTVWQWALAHCTMSCAVSGVLAVFRSPVESISSHLSVVSQQSFALPCAVPESASSVRGHAFMWWRQHNSNQANTPTVSFFLFSYFLPAHQFWKNFRTLPIHNDIHTLVPWRPLTRRGSLGFASTSRISSTQSAPSLWNRKMLSFLSQLQVGFRRRVLVRRAREQFTNGSHFLVYIRQTLSHQMALSFPELAARAWACHLKKSEHSHTDCMRNDYHHHNEREHNYHNHNHHSCTRKHSRPSRLQDHDNARTTRLRSRRALRHRHANINPSPTRGRNDKRLHGFESLWHWSNIHSC